MLVLSSVHVEFLLVCFESYTVFVETSNQHLIARHVIIHHVLQKWLEGFSIHNIKVNQFFGRDLESIVLFDAVDEASEANMMILLPIPFIILFVFDSFEKEDLY